MTQDQRERLNRLCARIPVEKDRQLVDKMVRELNDLLTEGEEELGTEKKPN